MTDTTPTTPLDLDAVVKLTVEEENDIFDTMQQGSAEVEQLVARILASRTSDLVEEVKSKAAEIAEMQNVLEELTHRRGDVILKARAERDAAIARAEAVEAKVAAGLEETNKAMQQASRAVRHDAHNLALAKIRDALTEVPKRCSTCGGRGLVAIDRGMGPGPSEPCPDCSAALTEVQAGVGAGDHDA